MAINSVSAADIQTVFSRLLGDPIVSMERLGGGRNSGVYRLTCRNSRQYVAKRYFSRRSDGRDRLAVEFSSLQFLWKNGLRCVPQPILEDKDQECAIYEYIDGERLSSETVHDNDVDEVVRFLGKLKALRDFGESRSLPPASEACFSAQALTHAVSLRLERLTSLPEDGNSQQALRRFLSEEYLPSLDRITQWSKAAVEEMGLSFTQDLPISKRILSPSDFGFHNALRRGKEIVFLDFEYFGWDDPAKMIADFLLHPGIELAESHRQRFGAQVFGLFQDQKDLAQRVRAIWPLCGLNWCLIFLNEFIPEHLLRREFLSGRDLDRDGLLSQQLTKAQRMLENVVGNYEQVSYGH